MNDDNMNKDKGELNKTAIKIIPISNKKNLKNIDKDDEDMI